MLSPSRATQRHAERGQDALGDRDHGDQRPPGSGERRRGPAVDHEVDDVAQQRRGEQADRGGGDEQHEGGQARAGAVRPERARGRAVATSRPVAVGQSGSSAAPPPGSARRSRTRSRVDRPRPRRPSTTSTTRSVDGEQRRAGGDEDRACGRARRSRMPGAMRASVTASTAVVGSCRTSTARSAASARARATRWRCPPDRTATALGQRRAARPRGAPRRPRRPAAAPSPGRRAAGDGRRGGRRCPRSVPSNRSASCVGDQHGGPAAARPGRGRAAPTPSSSTHAGVRVGLAAQAAQQGGRVGRVGGDDAEQLAGPRRRGRARAGRPATTPRSRSSPVTGAAGARSPAPTAGGAASTSAIRAARGPALGESAVHPAEDLQRAEQEQREPDRRDQLAEADVALGGQPAADQRDDGDEDTRSAASIVPSARPPPGPRAGWRPASRGWSAGSGRRGRRLGADALEHAQPGDQVGGDAGRVRGPLLLDLAAPLQRAARAGGRARAAAAARRAARAGRAARRSTAARRR